MVFLFFDLILTYLSFWLSMIISSSIHVAIKAIILLFFGQPTPVFLPGESQGLRVLVGCPLWGRTDSDTTEAT